MMIRTRNPYFRLVDDLLSDAFGSGGQFEARGFGLALDVEESPDAYIVRANLPGVALDDISVNIHEDVLTIAGETVSEARGEDSRLLIRERRSGKFSRSLRFPTVVNGEAVGANIRGRRAQHHPAQGGTRQAAADTGQGQRREQLNPSSTRRRERWANPPPLVRATVTRLFYRCLTSISLRFSSLQARALSFRIHQLAGSRVYPCSTARRKSKSAPINHRSV